MTRINIEEAKEKKKVSLSEQGRKGAKLQASKDKTKISLVLFISHLGVILYSRYFPSRNKNPA